MESNQIKTPRGRRTAIVYTDGATVGHNGKLGTVEEVGLGIHVRIGEEIRAYAKVKGMSNNEAEFLALITAMKLCLKQQVDEAVFNSDSKIVVNRANGSRPIKSKFRNERMDAFQNIVLDLARGFKKVTFNWIPREKNQIADGLSKKGANSK